VSFGKYTSNEETVMHDGTILPKIGVTDDEIKAKISFDITIKLVSGTNYSGRVTLNLPVGNITTEGTSNFEKTDFSDVIFKRN